MLSIITDVGPITHAFAIGDEELDAVTSMDLQNFEAAVRNLRATGGGDYPEYALGAMLAALNYSFIDVDGYPFTPMDYDSELVVITDATSLQPELEETVIEMAMDQFVSIHFILPDHDYDGYAVYSNIAMATGGTVYRDDQSTWSILKFHERLSGSGKRKKRSTSPRDLTVQVSMFTRTLRVSTLTRSLSSGTAHITTPDKMIETATIESNVMIYIKSHPLPGTYVFRLGAVVNEHLIRQDISLDVSLFYLDKDFTVSSPKPLLACKYCIAEVGQGCWLI